MKKIIFCLIFICLITGCSKTEQDSSFQTEINGTYTNNINASNTEYVKNEKYILKENSNKYVHIVYEKSDGKIINDYTNQDEINTIDKINDDVFKIELNNGSSFEIVLYKYKNMLGNFYKTEIPTRKTFNLLLQNDESDINEGLAFNKKGYYHYCTDYDNCTDDSKTFTKYKRKGNYIYQADAKGNWTILLYIVKDGLFSKVYTKEK